MNELLKEPLLHFLLIGVALFLVFELTAEGDETIGDKVIVVDRDVLLMFVQFRTRAFDPKLAGERLDKMTEVELELLIDDYVREEALYREALSLGLDKNDYVIKRRMIQSVEFISDGFVSAHTEVSDADARAHYQANRDDYYVEPSVTFTHVFFNAERHGRDGADQLATQKLTELNAEHVSFTEAPQHGDRFLYLLNYVERVPGFVESHFGAELRKAVFALAPDEHNWVGPFRSQYGSHLILLVDKTEGSHAAFEDVEDLVRKDAERVATEEKQAEAIDLIVEGYEIQRDLKAAASAAG
jgi:parvulin-like peptidyl-prolyl isomerase